MGSDLIQELVVLNYYLATFGGLILITAVICIVGFLLYGWTTEIVEFLRNYKVNKYRGKGRGATYINHKRRK